jgi:hypothetical protein
MNQAIPTRPDNMKRFLAAVVALLCLTNVFAGERIDAAAWKNVRTYDVPTLLKQEATLLGKVVAVHFQYRSAKLRHSYPRIYEGAIWQRDANSTKGYSGLQVMVLKENVKAFETITSDSNSAAELTVYAVVEKHPDANATRLRLLGRKVTTDTAGNATVDW